MIVKIEVQMLNVDSSGLAEVFVLFHIEEGITTADR